ncbi:tyrosine-type recombinase/integrase [Thiocystis violascens]|uniref:Site-specific recombinase XerD n=1 Tax=Thiocystis violascens (strain ATCC 17096 / DSM 198 / 6111) TaxID=765911 RepID=I3Y9B2_THIV6|nr:site-specific integrase [Thiocystis violascens]AFL73580.1 site-specific recombinase XerD [Thiocystis violascens DSM 198]
MPKKRFTVPFVEKVLPPTDKPQEDYFDTVLPAFGLRVGRKRKTYFVMVRVLRDGEWKMTRANIGTTAELDLASARQQAQEAMDRAAKGFAPAEVKVERKAAQADESRNTFSAVRDEFLTKYRGRQNRKPAPRTLAEIKRVLNTDLFAAWNDRPLAKISRRDVLDVLDVLVERDAEVMANRTLAYLSMLFGWAMHREIITTDPTDNIKKPGSEQSRERVLSLDELRAIWQATEANQGDLFSGIVRVLMLTGQRRDEVGGMRWSELDLSAATWTLPTNRTKNHREHIVPLTAPVVEILQARQTEQDAMRLKTDYVFTSFGPRPFSGWSKSKARLDGRASIAKWTLHDLRRTLATRLAEDLHIPPHIIEATINHVSGARAGVAGTYNRALYLEERRNALDAWAGYVLRVVGAVETGNVVEMRAHG